MWKKFITDCYNFVLINHFYIIFFNQKPSFGNYKRLNSGANHLIKSFAKFSFLFLYLIIIK